MNEQKGSYGASRTVDASRCSALLDKRRTVLSTPGRHATGTALTLPYLPALPITSQFDAAGCGELPSWVHSLYVWATL